MYGYWRVVQEQQSGLIVCGACERAGEGWKRVSVSGVEEEGRSG